MNGESTLLKLPKREVCWDILRVLCTLALAFIHVSVHNYGVLEQGSTVWNVCNFYNGIARYCITLLFMISGLFLLDSNREYPIKKLYGKKILRLLVAYIFWATVYSLVQSFIKTQAINKLFIKNFVWNFIFARYHLWFLLSLAAAYMIVPFLRIIAKNKTLNKYFLVLWMFFSVIAPMLTWIPGVVGEGASYIINDSNMTFVVGYSGLMILGNYLKSTELNKKTRVIIYATSILSVAVSIFANRWVAGTHIDLYGNFAPASVLISVAIFVFVKQFAAEHTFGPKTEKMITTFGAMGFGIYLSHDLFITLYMDVLGINTLTMPIIVIPLLCVLVLGSSFVLTLLIRKLPFGKWIA